MKKRAVLSILLALTLISSTLLLSASALTMGDVDGDGGIKAADARLALRASVGLENLDENQKKAADVDYDGAIKAADARLILRASVGLEELHTHEYTKETVTKKATCTEKGEKKLSCECGDFITEEIAAAGHKEVTDKAVAPTCTKEGKTEGTHCSVCNEVLQKQQAVPATGHVFSKREVIEEATSEKYGSVRYYCCFCDEYETITTCTHTIPSIKTDSYTPCAVSGCKGQFPSFNNLVNVLKSPGSRNFYYGFTKNATNTEKPVCKADTSNALDALGNLALAEMMEGLLSDSITPGNVTEYTDFTNGRHINNATYFVTGKAYVSALKDKDVKSIKMEKMNGVDFVKSLPNSFTSSESGTQYNLKGYKNASVGDVYKVSVTLNTETMTNKNITYGVTPVEKILSSDYNTGLRENMNNLNGSFSDMPELEELLRMNIEIKTDCEVIYYFRTDSLEPVACVYNVDMSTNTIVQTYFNNLFIKKDKPTTTLTIKNTAEQNNYYFFNDYLGQ